MYALASVLTATPRAAGHVCACRYAAVYVEVCAGDEGAQRLLEGLFPASTVKPLILDPPAGVGESKGRSPEAVASELRGGPVEVVDVGAGGGAGEWTWLVESGMLPEEVYYLKARVPFAQVQMCVRVFGVCVCIRARMHACNGHGYVHTHTDTHTHTRARAHTHTIEGVHDITGRVPWTQMLYAT